MTELDELLLAFQRVCIADVDPRDVARLENGGGPAGRFTSVYRDMVRTRLRDLVAAAYPRTARAIGRAAMDTLADRHIESSPPSTRFFREHAESFASWAIEAMERTPIGPPWTRDLLRLEAAQWPANYRQSPPPSDLVSFDLELVPVPSRTLALCSLEWSVHRTADGAIDRDPERGAFDVAVYRRPDHLVETRWMAPIWASMLARMARADEPAITSVRETLAAHARAPDAPFVDEMTSFVAALVDNGAILGSVPDER